MSTNPDIAPAAANSLNDLADVQKIATRVLRIESDAILGMIPHIGEDFQRACQLCMQCTGRIVVTGMGKSGHVANKIAATLASTGTPAFYVHPAEASHGDIGMITVQDVVLAASYSGETSEILLMLPTIKRLGVPLIALTGRDNSTLAEAATVHLSVGVSEEACPLNLAPTASTTATLALGDALALVLLEGRGFTSQDFALSHPGGTLGKKLLLRVADVMRVGKEVATTHPDTPVGQALIGMSKQGLGMTVVIGDNGKLLGVFTDGDLRRVIDARMDVHKILMADVMISECKTARPDMLAAEAVHIMQKFRITALPVVDAENQLLGALNIHDLFRAGVV
ncbi:MAG: KpsF/GutQ family sugar-phosphate isomerase [Gammaproteobacteria bacterium]|nr:KpsF/GutQ family sugar-phosphate isomerase [Gammaproteobacteria bacterium]